MKEETKSKFDLIFRESDGSLRIETVHEVNKAAARQMAGKAVKKLKAIVFIDQNSEA